MNRPDISRLNKNRSIYLKVGFIIALGLTVMAFNYTVYEEENKDYQVRVEMQDDILEEVVRTTHKEKRQPPPPVMKPTKEYIEEEVIFDPEPVPDPEPIEKKVVIIDKPVMPKAKPIIPEPKPVVLPEEPEEKLPELFTIVEQMPRFPGCEDANLSENDIKACADKELLDFIYSKVKYPPLARENGIEGVVVVSFVVEKDGSISGLKTIKDIGGGCAKEVRRIVNAMPNWIPGEQRKRKVRVQFNLPVKFSLN